MLLSIQTSRVRPTRIGIVHGGRALIDEALTLIEVTGGDIALENIQSDGSHANLSGIIDSVSHHSLGDTMPRHLRGNTQCMDECELVVVQRLFPIHLLVPLVALMVHHHSRHNFIIDHVNEQLTVRDRSR